MSATIENFISNNYLLIFFAIVVFVMISKPKFLEKFFQPEHFKPDICAKCESILSSCDPDNPSSICKFCQSKCSSTSNLESEPEHFKSDICAKCASILSSCDPANPSSRCKMCLRKCPTALGSVALGSVASDSVSSESVASDPATSDTDTSDTTTSENFAPTYESKSKK